MASSRYRGAYFNRGYMPVPAMFPYQLQFDRVWYLGLLALLPLLWWLSYRRLASLGWGRRLAVLALRSIVLTLLILALAEAQLVRVSDRITVIYLLDQSLSIPEAQRQKMIAFVNASIRRHRHKDGEDRAGVVVFARDAAVEIPPLDYDVEMVPAIESVLDPEHTDLAGAMQMALALFPDDAAKRIVLVTDGNQNLGDARQQAQALAEKGVSIDVLPVRLHARSEVAVEKISIPPDVRGGQPFDLRVVVSNRGRAAAAVTGKLRVTRGTGDREVTLAEQDVRLPAGKRVLSVREQIDQPDFYTYEARFIPDDPADDVMPQNNRATIFTHVRGRGHVLLIEDWANKGRFDFLVGRLRHENLEVTVQSSDQLFSSLAELQRYDTVVLADVPRSSGDDAQNISHFSDDQVRMLVRNTQQMGSGLVMLGGPNSLGAGGWTNTELEQAMPVDFEVKSAEVVPVGALVLMMHASEMARGNHWQKVVAREAISALGAQDYCGLLHFNGTDQWLWSAREGGLTRVGRARTQMLARLDRMTPGDMPQFEPAMLMAVAGFAGLPDAAVKHMIIISDGDPSPPDFGPAGSIQALKNLGVKVSTVAVGTHGPPGSTPLQRIATLTGATYYVVTNASALPRIYQREARRVARPLVYEDSRGLIPQVRFPHEMIKGLSEPIPPVTGFVLTTLKESHLVEVVLTSPRPAGEQNNTLLAGWTYGVGRTVVLTTDAGARWAKPWTVWDQYDRLFSQIIRWSMRPVGDHGNFTVATDVEDGKGRIVVTALDKDDEFLNFLDVSATVLGPDLKVAPVTVRQTASGRYVGEFTARAAGSYFVMVNPGSGRAPIRSGLNVSYSDEFRDQETNRALLATVVALAPRKGRPGQLLGDLAGDTDIGQLLAVNPFRHDLPKASASRDVWHLLVLTGGCVFFLDVLVRRVHLNLAWASPLLAKVRQTVFRHRPQPAETETLRRLRHRKAEVEDRIQRRRAAARFEPEAETVVDIDLLPAAAAGEAEHRTKQEPPPGLAPGEDELSYTERLLRAKKRVWEDRR